jgi:hypothetical protein
MGRRTVRSSGGRQRWALYGGSYLLAGRSPLRMAQPFVVGCLCGDVGNVEIAPERA